MARYRETATAAGAEVEFFPEVDLEPRLRDFLNREAIREIALPSSGWPPALRAAVAGVLEAAGCRAVGPRAQGEGFAWDRKELARAGLGITFCPVYLGDTGSLVFPAGPGMGTLASLLPPVHLALSVLEGLKEGLGEYLSETRGLLPSRLTLVSGPSRTGDIEATMTKGVHGPGRVLHWILNDGP
jgi:L-lactate utilization protein LutC